MKKSLNLFAVLLFSALSAGAAQAQLPPFGTTALLPLNPTSFDSLKLSMLDSSCGGAFRYKADAYRVSMSQNVITVTLGETEHNLRTLCPASSREEIDLGRLPAGNYTLNVIEAANGVAPRSGVVIANAPFTVTDARAAKTAPYVRLDYSGHWWDPNDSGWGLFIWHDARDNLLAAWFTYAADGKPIWYTFQPKWQTSSATFETALLQTSRAPGATVPPPNPTTFVVAGAVSLDFTNFGTADEGKLIYTLTGSAKQVRNIQRFKP